MQALVLPVREFLFLARQTPAGMTALLWVSTAANELMLQAQQEAAKLSQNNTRLETELARSEHHLNEANTELKTLNATKNELISAKKQLGVMRELGMLPAARTKRRDRHAPVAARSSSWVRAPQSGILRATLALGARVAKGDVLGVIANPLGEH